MNAVAKQPKGAPSEPEEKSGPKTKNVRMMADVADAITFVAARRGIPTAKLIDHLVRQWAMTEQKIESAKLEEQNRRRQSSD